MMGESNAGSSTPLRKQTREAKRIIRFGSRAPEGKRALQNHLSVFHLPMLLYRYNHEEPGTHDVINLAFVHGVYCGVMNAM
jgi:hypothetical protein